MYRTILMLASSKNEIGFMKLASWMETLEKVKMEGPVWFYVSSILLLEAVKCEIFFWWGWMSEIWKWMGQDGELGIKIKCLLVSFDCFLEIIIIRLSWSIDSVTICGGFRVNCAQTAVVSIPAKFGDVRERHDERTCFLEGKPIEDYGGADYAGGSPGKFSFCSRLRSINTKFGKWHDYFVRLFRYWSPRRADQLPAQWCSSRG